MSKNTKSILIGLIAIVLGLLLTSASYSGSNELGSYRIFYGAVIYGVYKIIKGIHGNMPKVANTKKQHTKSIEPYIVLGISNTVSNEELNKGYRQIINDYNLAIQNDSKSLDEYKAKLMAYRTILEKRDFTKNL